MPLNAMRSTGAASRLAGGIPASCSSGGPAPTLLAMTKADPPKPCPKARRRALGESHGVSTRRETCPENAFKAVRTAFNLVAHAPRDGAWRDKSDIRATVSFMTPNHPSASTGWVEELAVVVSSDDDTVWHCY